MNTSNLKDTVSTICAWVTVIGGAILGAQAIGQITLPEVVVGILGTAVGLAVAITQFLTGKLPNGTVKSESQIVKANTTGTEDKVIEAVNNGKK